MIELIRSYGALLDESLTWKPSKLDGVQTATIECRNGHYGWLSDHEIAVDGTVSPSVVCPDEQCTFHEFIKLTGWKDR